MQTSIEHAFDEATIDALAAGGYVVVDDWLGHAAAVALRSNLRALMDLGCFAPARVGGGSERQEAPALRSDSVCWFDPATGPEARDGRLGVLPGPEVGVFLARIGLLRAHLNRTCFLSLSAVECHATCYEPGAFYAAHLDTPIGDSRRVISFTYYLSERSSGETGGCLRLHGVGPTPVDGAGPTPIDIEPLFDRLIVFQSRSVVHEVLPVAAQRLSLTGWMSGS